MISQSFQGYPCQMKAPEHPVTEAVQDAVEALERLPVETQYAAASLLRRATQIAALRGGVSKTALSSIDQQVERHGADLDLLMLQAGNAPQA